jgi:hypothetical protein
MEPTKYVLGILEVQYSHKVVRMADINMTEQRPD